MNNILFKSCFAKELDEFISLKHAQGFIYDSQCYILKHFDVFCFSNNVTEPVITKELVDAWVQSMPNIKAVSVAGRVVLYHKS